MAFGIRSRKPTHGPTRSHPALVASSVLLITARAGLALAHGFQGADTASRAPWENLRGKACRESGAGLLSLSPAHTLRWMPVSLSCASWDP